MKRNIWLIVAVVLIIAGGVIFAFAMDTCGWDFTRLAIEEYERNVYEIDESFSKIQIDEDTADIRILPSEDGKCRVEFLEKASLKHSATVEGDTLSIRFADTRKWYEHISLFGSKRGITLYLPEGEYGDLNIAATTADISLPHGFVFESINIALSTGDVECRASAVGRIQIAVSTGDVRVENVRTGELSVATTTGDVLVKGLNSDGEVKVTTDTGEVDMIDTVCKSLFTEGDTGDLFLKNFVASEAFWIERNTGDVTLERCDAAEIRIETSTGDVVGSLLSDKTFFVEADTGDTRIPQGTSGGRCEIQTDTGDVEISIRP